MTLAIRSVSHDLKKQIFLFITFVIIVLAGYTL